MNDQEEATLIQTLWGKGSVTVFDRLLFRNFFHVSNRPAEDLPAYLRREPSAHLAIVACSDCQIDPNDIFKLRPGEAIILQNGGGASNPDLIRSLIVAVYELGVNNIVVLGHVNCSFKGLNVDHLEMKTSKAAKINAASFGFSDPKIFYRPIDDVLEHTLQQAKILRTHPLFKQRVEILALLYDDAKGFVYNADTLKASMATQTAKSGPPAAPPSTTGDTLITIKPDTPKQIAVEIEKLIGKFPANPAFVIKVLRNWQWEKYIEEHVQALSRRERPKAVAMSITDLLKSAAVEKLATLNKLIALIPESPAPVPAVSRPTAEIVEAGSEAERGTGTRSQQKPIETAGSMTSATTQGIADTIKAAQQAIPKQIVSQVPRVVIPKISIPRALIPRFHFVVEYPQKEKGPGEYPEEKKVADESSEEENESGDYSEGEKESGEESEEQKESD